MKVCLLCQQTFKEKSPRHNFCGQVCRQAFTKRSRLHRDHTASEGAPAPKRARKVKPKKASSGEEPSKPKKVLTQRFITDTIVVLRPLPISTNKVAEWKHKWTGKVITNPLDTEKLQANLDERARLRELWSSRGGQAKPRTQALTSMVDVQFARIVEKRIPMVLSNFDNYEWVARYKKLGYLTLASTPPALRKQIEQKLKRSLATSCPFIIDEDPDEELCRRMYTRTAIVCHPDKPTGNKKDFLRLNAAWDRLSEDFYGQTYEDGPNMTHFQKVCAKLQKRSAFGSTQRSRKKVSATVKADAADID